MEQNLPMNDEELDIASSQIQESNMQPVSDKMQKLADDRVSRSVDAWSGIPQGEVLPNVVNGKEYKSGDAIEELTWLKEIGGVINRTDFNSKYEVAKLQKSLRPWLQYYGDGFMIGVDGVPGDDTIEAVKMFQNKSEALINNRAKLVSNGKDIEQWMMNEMQKQEFDLFSK